MIWLCLLSFIILYFYNFLYPWMRNIKKVYQGRGYYIDYSHIISKLLLWWRYDTGTITIFLSLPHLHQSSWYNPTWPSFKQSISFIHNASSQPWLSSMIFGNQSYYWVNAQRWGHEYTLSTLANFVGTRLKGYLKGSNEQIMNKDLTKWKYSLFTFTLPPSELPPFP